MNIDIANLTGGRAVLTVDDCARITGFSPCTIRRAIIAKRLAVIKPNGKHGKTLVLTVDLIRWLDRSRVAAVGE